MDEITVIHTDKAPAALGPYSQALAWNGLLVLSGQTGLDPVTGELVSDFAGQVRQVLDNLGAVLSQAGAGFADVLAADVFLTDMGRFAEFNAIYAEYFREHKPARTTVAVSALPKNGQVEIKFLARLPRS
ncbi:MAG TPA: Rid family detoxifying hydrolase [Desulfovibrio sp.]|jgi:2-iminobutanoate/2-iminopropanoate deaminase|uniref:Rid family detoxifying hydrolase n=1 Tax=Desulfovibrio TaxID=872 RepID=UPI00041DBBDB|nr:MULTISPECIES: Rid family detoxifying hydrolase [Desulfovibrio]HMM39376.1 Rid family detoxifying hydrolase [Desulfovibrio sp.]